MLKGLNRDSIERNDNLAKQGFKAPGLVQGARRINFDEFLTALFKISEKRGHGLEETVSAICNAGGPTVKCVTADYVKFHDDKVIHPYSPYLVRPWQPAHRVCSRTARESWDPQS